MLLGVDVGGTFTDAVALDILLGVRDGVVIELDGGQHFSDHAERADAARSAIIESQGFKVLRFSNLDVMKNRAGVLETIAAAVAERAPTLTLPRKRERGQEKPSS